MFDFLHLEDNLKMHNYHKHWNFHSNNCSCFQWYNLMLYLQCYTQHQYNCYDKHLCHNQKYFFTMRTCSRPDRYITIIVIANIFTSIVSGLITNTTVNNIIISIINIIISCRLFRIAFSQSLPLVYLQLILGPICFAILDLRIINCSYILDSFA